MRLCRGRHCQGNTATTAGGPRGMRAASSQGSLSKPPGWPVQRGGKDPNGPKILLLHLATQGWSYTSGPGPTPNSIRGAKMGQRRKKLP